jgi:hypothetical protein
MTSYYLNMTWMELAEGNIQEIRIMPVPTDANDMGVAKWSSSDTKVATVSKLGIVKGLILGKATVTCNLDGIVRTVDVGVSDVFPFKGPHILTPDPEVWLQIAGVNFDLGGENKAWYRSGGNENDGNMSNLTTGYRATNGDPGCRMNMESNSGIFGSNLGWTDNGQWVLYSIDVEQTGDYIFDLYCSVNTGEESTVGGYSLQIDGVPFPADGTSIRLNGNGSWSGWRWYHSRVDNPDFPGVLNLKEGRHKIKFLYRSGNFNYSGLRLRALAEDE